MDRRGGWRGPADENPETKSKEFDWGKEADSEESSRNGK